MEAESIAVSKMLPLVLIWANGCIKDIAEITPLRISGNLGLDRFSSPLGYLCKFLMNYWEGERQTQTEIEQEIDRQIETETDKDTDTEEENYKGGPLEVERA